MDIPRKLLRRQCAKLLPRPGPRLIHLALDGKSPLLQRCVGRRASGEDGEALHEVLARWDPVVALGLPAPTTKAAGDEPSTHADTPYRRASPRIHSFWHAAGGR